MDSQNFAELAFEVRLGAEDLAALDYKEGCKNIFKAWGFVRDRLEEIYPEALEQHKTGLRLYFLEEYEINYTKAETKFSEENAFTLDA